jgi:UrcA family protein
MSVRIMLASLAITLTAAPAFAASQDQVSVEIGVDDLDLSTAKDQERLDTRIQSAAQKICRLGIGGTAARVIETGCIKAVLASTTPQVEVAIANSRNPVRIAAVKLNRGS